MSTNTTTPAVSAAAEVPCACRAVLVDGKRSGCQRTTKRTFAPGHDAQLKGRLIRAAVAGSEVAWAADPKTAVSVAEVAGSHGFGHQVRDGVVRAQRLEQEKAARKAARAALAEANRATREAAKADAQAKRDEAKQRRLADKLVADVAKAKAKAPKTVQAKVGRWTYEGTVGKGGVFAYTTKSGEQKTADKGTYELVSAA